MTETPASICSATEAVLSKDEAQKILLRLPDWNLSEDGKSITRDMRFKGFAKATYAANLAIWLADQTGHHPDMKLGWGYCAITFTTHEAGGLTAVDLICAEKFDKLLQGA